MTAAATEQALIDAVLPFWFGVEAPGRDLAYQPRWFEKDPAFDAEIRARLGPLHDAAAAGGHDALVTSPHGALAQVILLDQVPRNLFRDSPRAFATDPQARALTRTALDRGWDQALHPLERLFLYLPLEHSESLADQDLSVALMTPLGERFADYAERHRVIIARFGRFPHRNAALGRDSTAEERDFLTQPGSSF